MPILGHLRLYIYNHAKTSYGPVFLMICKSLLQKVKDNALGLYTALSIMVILDRYIQYPDSFIIGWPY